MIGVLPEERCGSGRLPGYFGGFCFRTAEPRSGGRRRLIAAEREVGYARPAFFSGKRSASFGPGSSRESASIRTYPYQISSK
jgi:hypothetical protein